MNLLADPIDGLDEPTATAPVACFADDGLDQSTVAAPALDFSADGLGTVQTPVAPAVRVGAAWMDADPGTARQPIRPLLPVRAELRAAEHVAPTRWVRDLIEKSPEPSRKGRTTVHELPKAGTRFLDFVLEEEIGRGAFGRVYLARQGDLAGRRVALKVSVDLGGEVQNLAQLQHTNIMPIYSAHQTNGLHAVCMPYYSRTTLSDLCRQLQVLGTLPASGQFVISTLRSLQAASTKGPGDPTGYRSSSEAPGSCVAPGHPPAAAAAPAADLSGVAAALDGAHASHASYVDSILWMVARLADGLAHAHDRGILHRDLKPANILLTPDGTPLLLDFGLAEDTKQRAAHAAKMAGTAPYMSPEQMAIFGGGAGTLDARSDLYALGLILFQLLAGRPAHPTYPGPMRAALPKMLADRRGPAPSVRTHNAAVTPAVDAIVRKCLQPLPVDRYATAHDLAEDIDLHLANQPLKHTPEPSTRERATKWCRRHPRLASPMSVIALAAAIGLTLTSVAVQHNLERRKAAYLQTQTEALAMAERFDTQKELADEYLSCQTENTKWLDTGVEHGLAALKEVSALDDPDWADGPLVSALPPEQRDHLRRQVGELSFVLARAAFLSPDRQNRVEELHGLAGRNLPAADAPLMEWQRQTFDPAAKTGAARLDDLKRVLETTNLTDRREQFLLATELQANGRYRESKKHLLALTADRPDDAGAWFMLGRAHQMLGESLDALQAYGRSITLKPRFAPGYYNRATVAEAMQNYTQAAADVNMAIHLQPALHSARILRAVVLLRQGLKPAALAEVTDLLKADGAPARAWFLRAKIRELSGDAAGAKKDLDHGMGLPVRDAESYVARGVARMKAEPAEAMRDFEAAAKLNPHDIAPLQNLANLEGEFLKRPEKAVEMIDRILERHPDYLPAVCSKGVYLARLGKAEEAVTAAEQALKLSDTPFAWYRAACVYALLAKTKPEHAATATALVAKSLRAGYGHQYLTIDADLDPLRPGREFSQLMDYSRLLSSLITPPSTRK